MIKSVIVNREIEPVIDLKNLTIVDYTEHDASRNGTLRVAARETAQLLLNSLFSLAIENSSAVIELPLNDVIPIPRATPLPDEASLTKWEQFARKKGIQKKKNNKFTYSEKFGEDRPTYGYGSEKNDPMGTWLVEVPEGEDPMADHIALAKAKLKTTATKNRKQQKGNQSGGNKFQQSEKQQLLDTQLRISKNSTASLGRFDESLTNDIKPKKAKKGASMITGNEIEKTRGLAHKVINKSKTPILKGKGKLADMGNKAKRRK